MVDARTIVVRLLLAALPLAVASCAQDRSQLYRQLQSDDPAERIAAMRQTADLGDANAVPLVVESLDSPNSDVRLFAQVALKKMTGHTMGYSHYDSVQDRQQALQRWRQWLAAGRPAVTPSSQPGQCCGTSQPASNAATREALQ